MNEITLQNDQATYTAIPNRFLDDYMPKANGEFVKVYLYLLRCSNMPSKLSIADIADQMNHTETDVLRALRFWEQEGLLKLSFADDASLNSITICELGKLESVKGKANQLNSTFSDTGKTILKYPFAVPPKKNFTNSELKNFLASEDVRQILYVAQKYLGTMLSDTDTGTILYFYDELHFSADLIEYLIEYCVSIGQRNMRYIQKVALSWAEKGYCTVEQAKADATTYSKNYFCVMKAFGINNRRLASSEITMIQKWLNEYEFTTDIITEACNRTIQTIHQPSFPYADSILENWNKQGVKRMADIIEQDKKHQKSSNQEKESVKNGKAEFKATNNRFNNLTPRNYAYDDLERQLLNR